MDLARYASTEFGEARPTIGPHGYVAYFPKPIPRELPLRPTTVTLLADAESALGRLAGAGRLLPDPHMLIRPYLLKEAVSSARIEGTQTDVEEVLEAAASDEPPNADVEEVVNYMQALDVAIELAPRVPLGIRALREIHQALLAGVRGRERQPGELRRSQNWIGTPGTPLGSALFVPPPPDQLDDLLADWERFANEDNGLPVLVCAALLHYQFETLHPFLDGNGRLGRLLIIFYLIVQSRLPEPLLYLSPYLEERRDEYYACLQGIRERGDFDSWLSLFLRGVRTQAIDAIWRTERLLDLREKYRASVGGLPGHAVKVVDLALERPVLTARMVEQHVGVSRPTALRLLNQLAERGLAEPARRGPRGQRRWVAREVLDVQTQPRQPTGPEA